MILCFIYAHLIALFWSGLGLDVIATGNAISSATTCATITPACLALHAVELVGWSGVASSILLRRPVLFPISIGIAFAMSLFRNIVLVGLIFTNTNCFNLIHAQCGFAVLISSLILLIFCYKFITR